MTSSTLLYLIILLSACGKTSNTDDKVSAIIQDKILAESLNSQSAKNLIEHVRKPYFVGDVNNDKQVDTAYVIYSRIIRVDGTIEKECISKNCEVTIKFSKSIPDLLIDQSLGVSVQKVGDLNDDGADEIILFSEWLEGYWYRIYVWTFQNGKWEEIARTKAFLSEDKDFEGRIIKTNSQFYLLGDGWDDSFAVLAQKSIKVKIEK